MVQKGHCLPTNYQNVDVESLNFTSVQSLVDVSIELQKCLCLFSIPVSAEYNKVCGRIKAYQFGNPDAFSQHTLGSISINEAYLSGISITHAWR